MNVVYDPWTVCCWKFYQKDKVHQGDFWSPISLDFPSSIHNYGNMDKCTICAGQSTYGRKRTNLDLAAFTCSFSPFARFPVKQEFLTLGIDFKIIETLKISLRKCQPTAKQRIALLWKFLAAVTELSARSWECCEKGRQSERLEKPPAECWKGG